MQTLRHIINVLETVAPLHLQESYDNSGLLYGNPDMEIRLAHVSLDLTDDVMEEAIQQGANLIIVHHPPVFKALKRLSHNDPISQLLIKAVKHDIALYAIHTNLDNVLWGVNGEIARRIGLKNVRVLSPLMHTHQKLITFVPPQYLEKVQSALFEAGAGSIGMYDEASFFSEGHGTFRPAPGATPFSGEVGKRSVEPEMKLELIFPVHLKYQIIDALKGSHPYETVAYDILQLDNQFHEFGGGIVGELAETVSGKTFLDQIKTSFHTGVIRYSGNIDKTIQKVALCGGSGKSLINNALREKADIFLTADLSYHDFFIPGNRMLLADMGHFESEQFTSDLLVGVLNEKSLTLPSLNLVLIQSSQLSYLTTYGYRKRILR